MPGMPSSRLKHCVLTIVTKDYDWQTQQNKTTALFNVGVKKTLTSAGNQKASVDRLTWSVRDIVKQNETLTCLLYPTSGRINRVVGVVELRGSVSGG